MKYCKTILNVLCVLCTLCGFSLAADKPNILVNLVNLATDSGETKSLAIERPESVTELKSLLEQSMSSGRSRSRHRQSSSP